MSLGGVPRAVIGAPVRTRCVLSATSTARIHRAGSRGHMRHYAMAFRISISAVVRVGLVVAVRDGMDLTGVVREFCGVDPWRPARFERGSGSVATPIPDATSDWMTTMSSLEYAIRGEKSAPEAAEPLSGATDRAAWSTANLGRPSQPRGPASPGTGAAARDRHAGGRGLGPHQGPTRRPPAGRSTGRPRGARPGGAARAVQLHVAVRPRPEAPRAPHHRYPTHARSVTPSKVLSHCCTTSISRNCFAPKPPGQAHR